MNNQVEEIKGKANIVEIIGERIELKRAGRHMKGLCPFHNEKTPSFLVSPELQIYKCFGCGEAGDVFTFLEKYEGMEFVDALKFVADRVGVELKKLPQISNENDKYIELNELAVQVYHYLLTKHKMGAGPMAYLLEKRQLTVDTINEFRIGFAPDKPDTLVSFLTNKKKKHPKDIVDAGLAVFARGRYIDRFRGRVVFPIENNRKQVIALAGRILPEYEKRDVGKYINSPETPIYHKSQSLFGLSRTKGDIARAKKVIIVEGELDMLSPWQRGIKNIVAIKGTAMTEDHVRILSRYANEFIMALDSDFAGNIAAIKGISFAQSAGVDICVVQMDKYKDPDDFVREDPEGFRHALVNTLDIWEFMINFIFDKHTSKERVSQSAISRELVPILSSIKDKIVQSHYVGEVAGRLGVPTEAVAQEIENYIRNNTKSVHVVSKLQKNNTREVPIEQMVEEEILSLAFGTDPNILLEEDYDKLLKEPFSVKLVKYLKEYLEEKITYSLAEFAREIPPEMQEKFQNLLLKDDIVDDVGDIDKLVDRLVRIRISKDKQECMNLMRKYEKSGDDEALKDVQERYKKILERQQSLDMPGS